MLRDLYQQIQGDAQPQEMMLGGKRYTTRKVYPVMDECPDIIEVNTLTGLVDYLKTNIDNLVLQNLICHVESPTVVSVLSALHGDFNQRSIFIRATVRERQAFFERFLDAEKFNIWLQSGFSDTALTVDGEIRATDKGLMLKYVGNVRDELVKGTGDDGVSQELTVKVGVASVADVTLPNPVILRPYRTFNEVDQPASSFVFRARSGPEFALFEADGGAWESEAMKSIKAFMEFKVKDLNVIA